MNNDFNVIEIKESELKSAYTRSILENLPEWFGDHQAIDDYVDKVSYLPYWAAISKEDMCIGFFAVQKHYQHTGDIYVCGVLPAYQRKGVGKAIYEAVENYLIQCGCKYVIVKTLSDMADYEPYEQTRKFYENIGFEPLITLTEMWDEENPCLIMFKSLI